MTAYKTDFHSWQRPSFNLLSHDQLDHIYAAALEVLARVGGEFHDPAAVALLSDAGARVENDKRVRIPDTLVADALQRASRQIVVCDRDGQRRLFLEGRNTYFGPGNHYLTHPQTKAHYRQQIWMPELISRKGYDAWQAEGGLTLRQRARAKLLKIMETHQPQPLIPEVLQEMDALLESAETSCKVT